MLSLFPSLERKVYQIYEGVPSTPARFIENTGYRGLQKIAMLRGKMKLKHYEAGGHHFEVLSCGNPHAPTLIWLHGFSDVIYSFAFAAGHLNQHFNILIPTIPGFDGDKHDIHRQFSLDDYTLLFNSLFDQITDSPFYLAGNSLGGAISIKYALLHPEKVIAIFPVDTAGVVPDVNAGIYRELLEGSNIFHINNLNEFNRFLRRIFHRPPNIPFLIKSHLYHEFRKNGVWYNKIMTDLTHGLFGAAGMVDLKIVEQYTLDSQLSALSVPVHVIWGTYDYVFPIEIGRYLANQAPNSSLSVIASCGHCPHIERPHEFSEILIQKTKL